MLHRLAALAALLACASAASADITVTTTGGPVTTKAPVVNGVQYPAHVNYDSSGVEKGTTANPFSVTFPAVPAVKIDSTSLGASAGAPLFVTVTNPSSGGGTIPTGTAGTPSASVLSVQGVAGGFGLPVTGTFWQAIQPVSGSISVANLPATQPVSGSVSVSNLPATQPVSGTVGLSNTYLGARLQDATGAAFGTAGNPIYVSGGGGGSTPTGAAGTPNAAVVSVQGVTGGSAVPVSGSVSVSNLPSTQAISAAALPLPAGAATASGVSAIVTALGTPEQAGATKPISAASLPLPAGAATAANQTAVQSAPGTSAMTANGMQGVTGGVPVNVTNLLPQLTSTAGLAISFGTSAATLFNANAARHFITIQVQGTPDTTGAHGCYINGIGSATLDARTACSSRAAAISKAPPTSARRRWASSAPTPRPPSIRARADSRTLPEVTA